MKKEIFYDIFLENNNNAGLDPIGPFSTLEEAEKTFAKLDRTCVSNTDHIRRHTISEEYADTEQV
jgi:hypothetical protein